VADHILPFLLDRPLSLLRADPETGEYLYQRTAPPGLPSWLPVRRIRSDQTALGYADHVVGGDRATLAYLVNLGFISFHPWASTVHAIDPPELMVFDVDPTEIAFREVRNAAMLVRSLLAAFKIRSWVKTSGGRGLHVLVPLEPAYTYDQVLTAASIITRMARQREPSLFTFDMRRARRRGKILIDVLRNRRGATLVSPYSVREYAGVPSRCRWNGANSSAGPTPRISTCGTRASACSRWASAGSTCRGVGRAPPSTRAMAAVRWSVRRTPRLSGRRPGVRRVGWVSSWIPPHCWRSCRCSADAGP
jgi:bifunctional non-homologous end joining protein LigD